MGKLKYVFKRIFKMDFKHFFEVINYVHEKSGKSRIYIFFDAIICGFKYQAGYMDYQLFEMYNMTREQRKTVVTRGKNNEIMKRFNNPEFIKYTRDKDLFNEKFSKYLNREWMIIDENDFDKFKDFIADKEYIIVKPTNGTCGKSVEKIKVSEHDDRELFKYLLDNKITLVEEVATQCETISKIHPTSINTVRVVTLKGKVLVAFLRMGNYNNVVDNFNHGGLVAPIDIEEGIIKYPAIDKAHNLYREHPISGVKIVGFKIPKWKEIKALCEGACKEIPELGYIGWDVCVGEDKPFLIEGNEFPGHDLYQLPPHRDGNWGIYPLFEKIIKGDE